MSSAALTATSSPAASAPEGPAHTATSQSPKPTSPDHHPTRGDRNAPHLTERHWWPPLGRSHGHQRAVFMTATGQFLLALDTLKLVPISERTVMPQTGRSIVSNVGHWRRGVQATPRPAERTGSQSTNARHRRRQWRAKRRQTPLDPRVSVTSQWGGWMPCKWSAVCGSHVSSPGCICT